jgi:predicted PurR-regulated permease PerM
MLIEDTMNKTTQPVLLPEWSARQIFTATLVIAAIGALFFLLFRYSNIVFILFLAFVISTAIRPAVDWLNRRGIPRAAGVITVYLAILLALGAVVFGTAPLLASQAGSIMNTAPKYYGDFRSSLFLSKNLVLQRIALNMPEELTPITPPASEAPAATAPAPAPETPETTSPPSPAAAVASPIPYLGIAARGVLWMVALFILGFYWTLERERTTRGLLLWVPMSRREGARELVDEIEDKLGSFVVGQMLLCLSIGLAAFIAYLIIGLPYTLVLALLAGITEVIPIIGPVLGALPAMMVALAVDPSKVWLVVLSTIIIQNLEGYLLVPRIMKRSVGINSTVTLLAFVAFTALFGLGGALVSVPLAAILQLLISRFFLTPNLTEVQQSELGRDQISIYRLEAQTLAKSLRRQLAESEEEGPSTEKTIDELEAITTELDSILSQFGEKGIEA